MPIRTVEELIHALQKEDPKAQVCLCGLDAWPAREVVSVKADHQLDVVVIEGNGWVQRNPR